MRVSDLQYELPAAAIAQQPAEPRDAARLLIDFADRPATHATVHQLSEFVGPGDVIVVNDTKVLRARLPLRKASGGTVEVFLLTPRNDERSEWEALVRPSKRVPAGSALYRGDADEPVVIVGEVLDDDGARCVRLLDVANADEATRFLADAGEMPLPPYIHSSLADPDRYQTVFARVAGSVAAPTAGLHLTDELLRRCEQAGAKIATVTLDVGLGTFRPIATDRVEDHRMHSERYVVPDETVSAVEGAERVVAIGTTALRSLEAYAATGEQSGSTDLFIHGDYNFRVVDRLMTNFHLPGSSLLALLNAFVGPRWRDLYALALHEGYRFLSFGDAMIVDRAPR